MTRVSVVHLHPTPYTIKSVICGWYRYYLFRISTIRSASVVEGLRVRGCPGARGPRRRHHGDPLVGEVERHLLAAHVQQRLLRRAAGHPAPGSCSCSPAGTAGCRPRPRAPAGCCCTGGWRRRAASLCSTPACPSYTHYNYLLQNSVHLYNKIVIINAYFIKWTTFLIFLQFSKKTQLVF